MIASRDSGMVSSRDAISTIRFCLDADPKVYGDNLNRKFLDAFYYAGLFRSTWPLLVLLN